MMSEPRPYTSLELPEELEITFMERLLTAVFGWWPDQNEPLDEAQSKEWKLYGSVPGLTRLMEPLSDRERSLIICKYGLHDGIRKTNRQTGEMFHIQPERARQIESRALAKMRGQARRLDAARQAS
jgi:DNA-directed RNA polymerase sigma subunit (sigma70/sigma32)